MNTRTLYSLPVKKRRSFKVRHKLRAIKLFEKTKNKSKVCRKFSINRATLRYWIANKAAYLAIHGNRTLRTNARER